MIILTFNAIPMAATLSVPYGSKKLFVMTIIKVCMIFVIDAGIPIIKISLTLLPVIFIWDGEHVSLFDFLITA